MEKKNLNLEIGQRYMITYPDGKSRVFHFEGGNPPMVRFEDNGAGVGVFALGEYTSIVSL